MVEVDEFGKVIDQTADLPVMDVFELLDIIPPNAKLTPEKSRGGISKKELRKISVFLKLIIGNVDINSFDVLKDS